MNKKLINKKTIIIFVAVLLFFIITGAVFFVINKDKSKREKIERTELQLLHPELLIEDIEPGQGKGAERGDGVILHYIGMLTDGTIFDSSYDKERTFSFIIGQGRVIPGWEIGIEGMRQGGKRRLTIPPELGYGESGVRGMVPSNATIIFEIELIEIQ